MVDEILETLNNKMELIETSSGTIHQVATVYAMITEPDDDTALEIFSLIRSRIRTGQEIYTYDGYLADIESLATIAELSGQLQVSKDLWDLYHLFEENPDHLAAILESFKRQDLFEGLRKNYRNN